MTAITPNTSKKQYEKSVSSKGIVWSTVSISAENLRDAFKMTRCAQGRLMPNIYIIANSNLFTMRPMGFVSKKLMGVRKILCKSLSWITFDARTQLMKTKSSRTTSQMQAQIPIPLYTPRYIRVCEGTHY